MNTGKYKLIDLLEHEGLEQFVVPEIQRDYVWKISDVQDFLDYIKQGYLGDESDKPYLGFIYAYNDRDYAYKYILVDGQQRLTTLFLLLLGCYHKAGKPLPDYMFNRNHLKLEYKVRQATHDFLLSLVNFCNLNPGLDFRIKDQLWHHNEYNSDRTIISLINNFSFIKHWLKNLKGDLQEFIGFIENEVTISYFDIDESRQGEDLYIYMNSRGRQLEPNETLKAKYLATTTEKEKWGAKWEEWQDFFWKNRGERPDADKGFNDFLKLVQAISMSEKGATSEAVSRFVSDRNDPEPEFEKLPETIEELSRIFDAYHWYVNAASIINLYSSVNEDADYLTTIPNPERRQIYFLRILPVISFLYKSGCRDEHVVVRIARYFYNIARKRAVGKDISNQLPAAIKLMLEFGDAKEDTFDVCQLVNYRKGRTVLIDTEEVYKLTIFSNAGSDREQIEKLFWASEDHRFTEGEISFFLDETYDADKQHFDLRLYEELWQVFQALFSTEVGSGKIAVALLYYGNTWLADSPWYYENFDCTNWKELLKSDKRSHLMRLIYDLKEQGVDLDILVRERIKGHFKQNSLTSIERLKSESRFFSQIQIIGALDFYTGKKLFHSSNGYIAKDNRYNYGDAPFFENGAELFNVYRYISDGSQGRLRRDMKDVLQDNIKLNEVLSLILN